MSHHRFQGNLCTVCLFQIVHTILNVLYVKAILFIRPTSENINNLCIELQKPKFGKYYIFFTNVISRAEIKRIAESDRNELVEQVQQFYCDFLPIGGNEWTVPSKVKIIETSKSFSSEGLIRCRDSLYSYLQSLNKSVGIVRYDGASALTKELSKEFVRFVEQSQNNNQNTTSAGTKKSTANIYIFDRRCDAITPLLQQWTYRAMLHELLTISRGQIDLSQVPNIEPDMQKIVLDPDIDTFYADNMNLNYGDVSANAQELIKKFQKEKSSQQKIDSIADMKAFLERYPAFKQLQSMTSKHLTLISELQKRVNSNKLMKISEYEQNLVTSGASLSVQDLAEVLKDGNVKNEDCIRLCSLYAARVLHDENAQKILDIPVLKSRSIRAECMRVVHQMKRYQRMNKEQFLGPWGFGANGPSILDDFRGKDFSGGLKRITDAVNNSLANNTSSLMENTENIYTQHKPAVIYLLDLIRQSDGNVTQLDLLNRTFPVEEFEGSGDGNGGSTKDIVIFMVGGWTFEESLAIYKFNRENQGRFRCTLAGTECLNSSIFMANINKVTSG